MSVCGHCTTVCQPYMARGGGLDKEHPLFPQPECAGWTVCNCACQASVRAEERRKMHTRGRAPAEAEKVELPEPMFPDL